VDIIEKGVWGQKEDQRQSDYIILKNIYTYIYMPPKIFTRIHVNVFDKYLHWPHVIVKKLCIHIGSVSVRSSAM
jgi:hypothetical protein